MEKCSRPNLEGKLEKHKETKLEMKDQENQDSDQGEQVQEEET
jgi:hypothetical protein